MDKKPVRSPFLEAEDLLRKQFDGMPLGELEEHAEAIRNVLVGLMDAIAASIMPSAVAMRSGDRLIKKLIARLDAVLSLIEDRQADMAEAEGPITESAEGAGGAGYRPPRP